MQPASTCIHIHIYSISTPYINPPTSIPLHRNHETSILIPVQQRILPALGLRVLNIRPAIHETLVGEDAGEFASDGAVHVLHYFKVCREEDVEVALLDL